MPKKSINDLAKSIEALEHRLRITTIISVAGLLTAVFAIVENLFKVF